ncbi:PAS domain-containing sensor histidine kinase [Candidatus Parcubacteria bacterium]|nr:PAS domain-containing sensor histidine kinase [Patescibacteria group bacterium]MBU4309607.1 PAS domain-containing sensor histidine kinase [Patescibacteria group bacterium]MBU4432149.1 PAS domain-containing sensor histidine kinase [Patescibacteria group bacterium]MBU4578005.1 PAS domain-containing sensor histidine kinase [Patescibacteria group bacterium]MCG2696487.1 PAS domain-containing sensor histidine kinase [Candidatus Parcubacteria bacterium]
MTEPKKLNHEEDNAAIASLMKTIEKSKKQYEQAIDAIQDSICVVNRNFEITSCNKAFANNVNLPIQKIKGLICRNVIPCFKNNLFSTHCILNNDCNTCPTQKVFLDQESTTLVQEFVDKSGKINYYKFNLFPIKNENNTIDQVVFVIKDITENKITEKKIEELNKNLEIKVKKRTEELNQANKELKREIKLKSNFISDASHELRTPLTIIQGNIDLEVHELKSKNKKIPELYEIIQKELTRMTGILNDLTDLTNSDAKTEKIEQEIVSLNIITKTAVRSLDILAKQKNIKLELAKNNPNINIIGDEQKLEKLLLNIIRNATKYTDVGGWIKVHLEEKNKIAKIIVEDNGIGVPPEDLPYIFERFYRVDKARSRQEGGTGLGLSICKWIAEAHGGNIQVESQEGVGTKFILELPITI